MRPESAKETTLTLHLSPEEVSELDKCAKTYPDRPNRCQTAQRLLDMELMRARRGASPRA